MLDGENRLFTLFILSFPFHSLNLIFANTLCIKHVIIMNSAKDKMGADHIGCVDVTLLLFFTMKTTLFVAGFGPRTRARNLACEFERYRVLCCRQPFPFPHISTIVFTCCQTTAMEKCVPMETETVPSFRQ